MSVYIDLSRRFRDLSKEELDEPEILASLNDHDYLPSFEWSELSNHPRVLLMAEAGSGKTREMQEQAWRIEAQGKFAFFIPLELLDQNNLVDILSRKQELAFQNWKLESGSKAWFFLDAVDELKLNQGKLIHALKRFGKAVDSYLDRVHVVISCRPTDWRADSDMEIFQKELPIVPSSLNVIPTADEFFISPLRKQENVQQGKEPTTKGAVVRSVVMLPLSGRQVEILANGLGVKDSAAFIAEINRKNAWTFARRPLDCSELMAIWNSLGQLGTRLDQHEANIRIKLGDEPDRPDSGVLSDNCIRVGAERLALALALTRTRTIRSPLSGPLSQDNFWSNLRG